MPKGKRSGGASNGGRPKPKQRSQNWPAKPMRQASHVGPDGGSVQRYNAPVAQGSVRTMGKARYGPTRIQHRESLGVLTPASTAFQVLIALAVNPALPASFPWLSNIAQQYETYKFRKLRFCYETRCATSTAGTVVLVTNYDASESAFTSLVQAENYRGAKVGQPWLSFCHDLDVKSMNDYNRHYCRAGAPVSGTDIKTYDVGTFQLCVSGAPASQIGELYVEYDVDLYDPRVQNPIGQFLPVWHAANDSQGGQLTPLASAVIRSGSTLGVTLASSSTVRVPNVGRYLVVFSVSNDISLTGVPSITLDGSSAAVSILNEDLSSSLAAYTGSIGIVYRIVDVLAPGSIWTFNGGASATYASVDVFITQISSGLTVPQTKEQKLEARLKELEAKLQTVADDRKHSEEAEMFQKVSPPPVASALTATGLPASDPRTTPSQKQGWFGSRP